MSRPTWNEYFLEIAQVVATRGSCDKAQVGCVVVQENKIVATGYNGAIEKQDHCFDKGHLEVNGACVRGIHAEENAVNSAAKFGVALNGATAYVTHFPCWRCFRSLVSAGIKKIYYTTAKYNDYTKELLGEVFLVCKTSDVDIYNSQEEIYWFLEMENIVKAREAKEKR